MIGLGDGHGTMGLCGHDVRFCTCGRKAQIEKLKIETNGAPPKVYGPFYVLCDVLIGEDGEAILTLSRDIRGDGHVYNLDHLANKMPMTKPAGDPDAT